MKYTMMIFCFFFSFSTAWANTESYSAFKRQGLRSRWNPSWTRAAIQEIERNRAALDLASDKENFCPGYNSASRNMQNNCWLRITSGIIAFESGNRANSVGDRWNPASNGGPAYGLMQIQARNCRSVGLGGSQLLQADANLKCGVAMMARLIKRDKYISSEAMVQGRHKARRRMLGLARGGWSTMRGAKMAFIRPLGKNVAVGHLQEIHGGVQTYLDHNLGVMAQRTETNLIPASRRRLFGILLT